MGFWDFVTGSTPAGIVSETGQKVVSGVFSGITELIKTVHLSPEDELKFKTGLAQLELQLYQAQVADVQSARQMQSQTKSIWPGLLSFVTLAGFFGAGAYIVRYGLPQTSAEGRDVIIMMANTLMTGVGLVYGFWLGTSHSSQQKDRMLLNSSPTNGNGK